MRKLTPITYLLMAILICIVLHIGFPVLRIFSWPWNVTGIVPLALGIWINLAADREFKR